MHSTTSNLLGKVTACPNLEESTIMLTSGIGSLIKRAAGNGEKLAFLVEDLTTNPNAWAAGVQANTPQAAHLWPSEQAHPGPAAARSAKASRTAGKAAAGTMPAAAITARPPKANGRKAASKQAAAA